MQGYNELIRKVKPKAVICYGEPFEEMQGKIIAIDYAKTNNLNNKNANDSIYIKKTMGSVIKFNEKGMGSVAGRKIIKLPNKVSQLKHIFRKKEGHIEDTPQNRSLLETVANNKENYVGTDSYGTQWYSQTRADGSQVWVRVRDNIIQNGGINNPPKTWNPSTGYNKPKGVD